jgi:hypothetical protein
MPNASNLPYLIPPGLFTCPRCGPVNAVTNLLSNGSLTTQVAGRCVRCEHLYQLTVGSPSTTTTGSSNTAGAAVLTVAAGGSFTSGSWVVIDSASVDGGLEVVKASAGGGSTTIPIASTPLRLTHAAGATVQTGTLVPLGPMT